MSGGMTGYRTAAARVARGKSVVSVDRAPLNIQSRGKTIAAACDLPSCFGTAD